MDNTCTRPHTQWMHDACEYPLTIHDKEYDECIVYVKERERRAREREARTFKHGPLADSILESGDAGAWYWLEVGSVHLVCLRFFVIRCILVHNPFSFQLYLHAVDGVMQ